MIQGFECNGSERLVAVVVLDGKDAGKEFNAYRVVITTDRRNLIVSGDHDGGPDLSEEPVRRRDV